MMRSMYSGVSGLRAHQAKMDVIGNNIANVNTTAFKAQRATFKEVFSQKLQSASSASDETGRGGLNPMQIGLGVNLSTIDILMTPGAAQRTDNPFDLMIDGDGFIVAGDASGNYFTRAGELRKDDDGNLIIPNGMKVMGWQASADGKSIVRSNVSALKLDSPQNKTANPLATTKLELSGNLNTADGIAGVPMQLQMFDSIGNLYSMNMMATYIPDATDSENSKWELKPVKGTGDQSNYTILTDKNSNPYPLELTSIDDITLQFDTNGNLKKPQDATDEHVFKFDIKGTHDDPPESFQLAGVNSTLGPISVDFSNITQFNAKTNIDPKILTGRAAGEMMGYDIGGDGIITAYYDNGEQRLLGQVVVAEFDNPAGLEKVGDNIYRATANSGDFDDIGKVGIFQAGVLEMSNVDLSQEFTEMITTQRGFQANSKIISTSDEMLHELVNLKR